MQDVKPLNAVGLAPEGAPVKSAPVTVLQVNKKGQDHEHNDASKNAFSIHE
jgi:hypothetical protein